MENSSSSFTTTRTAIFGSRISARVFVAVQILEPFADGGGGELGALVGFWLLKAVMWMVAIRAASVSEAGEMRRVMWCVVGQFSFCFWACRVVFSEVSNQTESILVDRTGFSEETTDVQVTTYLYSCIIWLSDNIGYIMGIAVRGVPYEYHSAQNIHHAPCVLTSGRILHISDVHI